MNRKILIIGGGYPASRLAHLLGGQDENIVIGGQRQPKHQFIKTPRDIVNFNLAERKRARRIERNIRNEARQGRYPELEQAQCRCGKWGEVNYDDGSLRGYFCGGSEWCCP